MVSFHLNLFRQKLRIFLLLSRLVHFYIVVVAHIHIILNLLLHSLTISFCTRASLELYVFSRFLISFLACTCYNNISLVLTCSLFHLSESQTEPSHGATIDLLLRITGESVIGPGPGLTLSYFLRQSFCACILLSRSCYI